MKIGELSGMFGVSCRQIRHYEKLGLLTSSRENSSNYRHYDQSSCERLEIIKLLRELDFSLNEIKQLLSSSQSSCIREIFVRKEAEIERDLSALSNRAHILKAVARVLDGHDPPNPNLAAVIKECSYIHSKNERMIPVLKDKVLIEIGIGLIPICEGEASPLICGIKKLRPLWEKEMDITVPPVRIRDNEEFEKYALSISIVGNPVCKKTYPSCQGVETADDVLALLASSLRDNYALFS